MRGQRSTPCLGIITVALVAAVIAPATTHAQGLYVGGAYSWATLDVSKVDASLFDDNASAYKLFAGYEFGNFFGVEGAWVRFGSYDARRLEGIDASPGQAELDGWGAALTGRLPLGPLVTVFGKVGYFAWDSQIKGTEDFLDQVGSRAKSGEDPFYGVGLRVNLGRLSVFGEWERYPRGNDIDSDLVSVGVRVGF